MVTDIEISRFFEPVPKLTVEARYQFKWLNGEFDSVKLSMRRDKGDDGVNSQFGKVEDIALSDVPDNVVVEAKSELNRYSQQLDEANTESDQ
jgi:hypothetical protein